MKSVLLISETEASFLYTPHTIALLQDSGFDVTVAADAKPIMEYARLATGKAAIPLMSGYYGFDAVLMAPYDCGHAMPKTDVFGNPRLYGSRYDLGAVESLRNAAAVLLLQ